MRKAKLEKTKELLKSINTNIRNEKTNNFIIENITKIIDNRKSKIEINDKWFVGMIKKNKESFMITFSPSLNNLQEIYIDSIDLDGCHKFIKTINFDGDIIKVKENDKNKILNTISKETYIEETSKEEIYLENNLVYSKDTFVDFGRDIREEKINYILLDGTCVENRIRQSDNIIISNRYLEAENFKSCKFNDKDHPKQVVINYFGEIGEEYYNRIKNSVETLLEEKSKVKIKK